MVTQHHFVLQRHSYDTIIFHFQLWQYFASDVEIFLLKKKKKKKL